ncbi:ABC transporter ATP-binding protein [Nitriliruptor alkaliphilus]|uniref:ABC transporter ATP-binding protein n=1 Tax=Nitriliruptor alkaliphilus TaxID=427918 RepID=UPI0006968827|nr:ATP-binding cassette domain-containing protein [Nitriliruptor alkaliphilus]
MSAEASVISVRGLDKVFPARGRGRPETHAVRDVSFDVAPGECVGIVGGSGSGKSTVARLLVGLERPTQGTMEVAGRDRSKPARKAAERRRRGRELQLVFQDPYTSLDPRQSARSCLAEVLALHGLGRGDANARIEELLEQVGLDDRQGRALPRKLSGGQRQRVAIARALAAEPLAIVLDEAVSGLDVSIQAQILNLLSDIRRATGVTYLFISHDLAVIRQIADRVLVMHHGEVVEEGPTERVLDHPAEPYTQLLRASVPRPGWRPSRRDGPVPSPTERLDIGSREA